MLTFLRFVGVVNAAVWLGAVVGFVVVTAPAFFSEAMSSLLPQAYAGAAELIVRERFFALQYWCAGIASGHLVAEWLYTGKPLRSWPTYVLAGLLALALVGGQGLRPKLQRLHQDRFGAHSTPQQRERAAAAHGTWEAATQAVNVLTMLGLLTYVCHVTTAGTIARFVSASKIRGLTKQVM